MNDLDALLKEFEQPNKSSIKENAHTQPQKSTKPSGGFPFDNPPQQQKFPAPSDNRKGNIPLFTNTNVNTEQRRTSILKQPPKPAVDQSFDIDAILQGRSIQPQQPSKFFNQLAPAKNSASSGRRDSWDWLNDDRTTTKTNTQKVTTHVTGKPAIDLNPDEFFSNASNNESRAPYSTTKTSAKQYYLGNARYKPGKTFFLSFRSIFHFF
jgi:hypothetical protein